MKRLLCVAGGILILGVCWIGPGFDAVHESFTVHMIVHMSVVAIAPALLVVGMTASRFDPTRSWPRLFSPLPATLVEFVAVWAWHTPRLHEFARASSVGFAIEQASFLLCGVYLWVAVLGGDRVVREERATAGIVGLLLTAMHMTLLGALIGLAPRVLYHHGHAMDASAGLELEDQQLGGAIMLLVGGVVYSSAAIAMMRDVLRRRRTSARGRADDVGLSTSPTRRDA